jgi:hypothetical protein
MFEPTKLKVALAFDPRVVMAAMQTTIMSDSITAYSTAVGPSSFFRKEHNFLQKAFIRPLSAGDSINLIVSQASG